MTILVTAVHFDHVTAVAYGTSKMYTEKSHTAVPYNMVLLQRNNYGLRSIPKFLEGVCARSSRDDDRQQRRDHREVQEHQLASGLHRDLRHGVDK